MIRLFIYLMWFFLVILTLTEGFSTSETSLFNPNRKGSYLLNSVSPSIPGRDVVVLAVDVDGTMYLEEPVSRKVLWSLSSGRPTYSSYQASRDYDEYETNTSLPENDFYVDCGEDWELYLNSSRVGKVKLPESAEEYLRRMPITSKDGVTVGKKKTTLLLVDAQSGKVLNTYGIDDSGSSSVVQSAEENSLVLVDHDDELVDSTAVETEKAKQRLYIKRIDYEMQHYTYSGKVLWNVTFSEFKVDLLCQEYESYFGGNDLNAEYANNFDIPISCPIFVHRIRGNSLSEFLSVGDRLRNAHPGGVLPLPASNHNPPLGAVGSLSLIDTATTAHAGVWVLPLPGSNYDPRLWPFETSALDDSSINNHPGGKSLYLPSSNNDPSLDAIHEFPLVPFNSEKVPVTALPYSKNENSVNLGIFHKMAGDMYIPWIIIPLFAALLSILGFFFNSSLAVTSYFKLNKQVDEFKGQAATPKKKKTRKSGNNKNNSNHERRLKNFSLENKFGYSNGHPIIEGNERNSLLDFIDLVDGRVDGRKIGKLLVSNKEIAKGSNGTIVLEGIYDGRPAAVKRLVRTHYDVALKEIQNLIASDQHPNIVRWYGVEYDQDFVYLSLERCACSLNEFIYINSESSQITKDQDSMFLTENKIQLHTFVESNKDVELWKANGYPSPQFLKLTRDVVCGLSHLHELGIIHRDLKPQNVLIIKERSLCAKLSDMGISKRLTGDISSFTLHATGSCGSSGWQAPEQLLQGRQTRAVDLFSLGCVLFFCLTGGKHPYGEIFERDVNIVNNKKDLFVVESIPEAWDLFSHLLDPNPDMRPRAVEVLHHPLFWSSEIRLSFLRDVSDRVELEDRENESELLNALESIGAVALNGKWDEKMENAFLNNIGRYRRYKFDSVRDLLRVIRNKSNHYRELPQEIQGILGQVPEGFDNYFSSRFPKLLIEVYKVIYRYCKEEEFFRKYITSNLI